jgi:hypothetical protein
MTKLVIDMNRSEVGPQRRKADSGRLLHCCCICGRLDTWGEGWSYYGSYRELEDGIPVPKFCSPACQVQGGPNAGNVTQEMKLAAQAAEWREPTIRYREATTAEKYSDALRDQRARQALTAGDTHGLG